MAIDFHSIVLTVLPEGWAIVQPVPSLLMEFGFTNADGISILSNLRGQMLGCPLLRKDEAPKLPHETSDGSYCSLSTSSDELGLLTEQGGLSAAFI